MRDDNPCKCCGVPLTPDRWERGNCPICDLCDKLHGDQLERVVRHLLEIKQVSFGHALVRCAIDDAHLSGYLEFRGPRTNAYPFVRQAPRRWEVVIGRACALGEVPAIADITAACLSPFIPGRVNRETMDAIAKEITDAFQWIDPDVERVEVDCKRDALDPQHLIIEITKRVNVAPGTVALVDDKTVIPDYIARQKTAQA